MWTINEQSNGLGLQLPLQCVSHQKELWQAEVCKTCHQCIHQTSGFGTSPSTTRLPHMAEPQVPLAHQHLSQQHQHQRVHGSGTDRRMDRPMDQEQCERKRRLNNQDSMESSKFFFRDSNGMKYYLITLGVISQAI